MNARIVLAAGCLMAFGTAALVVSQPKNSVGQTTGPNARTSPQQKSPAGRNGFLSLDGIPNFFRPGARQKPIPKPAAAPDAAPRTLSQVQGPVQQVQAQAGESEIQRQLRALYEKDGRGNEMPEMNIQNLLQQPNAAAPAGPRDLTRRAGGVPKKKSPIEFLRGLLPGGKKDKPKPVTVRKQPQPFQVQQPAHRLQPSPRVPMQRQYSPQVQPQVRSTPAKTAPAVPQPTFQAPFPQPTPQQSLVVEQQPGRVRLGTTPDDDDVPLFIDDRAPDARSIAKPAEQPAGKSDDMPLLIDDRGTTDAKTAEAPIEGPTTKTENSVGPQPFPSPAETSAGSTAADESETDENPFTGLKLSDETPAKAPDEPNPFEPAEPKAEINKVEIKSAQDLDSNKKNPLENDEEHPLTVKPRTVKAAPKSKEAATKEEGDKPDEESSIARKMRRIAERDGMTGFRGFCPVALRDRRDLKDARPEFAADYEDKTWYFASESARARFEESPEKYVPIHGGMDVVQGEDEEGSLQHAVWFRDRLYFFINAENMKAFAKEPKKFVKDEDE